MAGISTSGFGLPAATGSAFGTSAFGTSAGTVQQEGLHVQGPGGSTTLPAASPDDFAGVNPTPLDQPHPQYPTLIQSHVAVLQAIGTPEAVIAQLAQSQPQAAYLDRYIQGEIMQNPEGWDDFVGNPRGTARAGLQQLMPNVQLPAAGMGRPGYLGDGSTVSGVNVPGITQPLVSPEENGEGKLVKGLLIGAAAVGLAFVGWKFLKGRGIGGGGGDNALNMAKEAAESFAQGGGGFEALGKQLINSGIDAKDLQLVNRGLTMATLGGGGALAAGSTAKAATAWGVMNGLAPGTGTVMANHAAAQFAGISDTLAHKIAMDNRWMDVLEQLAKNGGTLGDAATAGVLASNALGRRGAAAAASGTQLAGLKDLLTGVVKTLG